MRTIKGQGFVMVHPWANGNQPDIDSIPAVWWRLHTGLNDYTYELMPIGGRNVR